MSADFWFRLMIVLYASHEGNAEEENNGYVVFKKKYPGWGGGVTPPAFLQAGFWIDNYVKTTWMFFLHRDICFMGPAIQMMAYNVQYTRVVSYISKWEQYL